MARYNREDSRTALPQIEKLIDTFIETVYPVGSVYTTTEERFDPAKTWGGRWEKTEESGKYIWHRTG